LIEHSLKDLGSLYNLLKVEQMAILVHEAMSGSHRKFHTTDHIFAILREGSHPIHNLAAVFHDIVYYNVDNGFTERIEELIEPYISFEMEQIFVRKKGPSKDEVFTLVNGIFGYKAGQTLLPYHGMNEYLSALVATKILFSEIGLKNTIAVITCIEASQPFRRKNDEGKCCFEVLEERLLKLNKQRNWGFQPSEIIQMVTVALYFANHDVINFAEKHPAYFLDNTWKLLPETNPILMTSKVYTVKKYRTALERMEIFFQQIDLSLIFHRYRNHPGEEEIVMLQQQAKKNIEMGRFYLGGRLLAMAILEALSELTGGDAPVVMFLGGNSRGNVDSKYEFNELIRRSPVELAVDVDASLLGLFEFESHGSILEFRKSPFSAFIYKTLGTKGMESALILAKRMFHGELKSDEFLQKLGPKVVGPVASACAEMVSTRKAKLKKWIA
jgi:hypothetical protein